MEFLKRIRSSTFARHNAVFFAGSLTVGILNYLYYPLVGRLLPPSAFGEVQTLFSLFLQIGILLNVLGLISINIVANATNSQQRNKVILEIEKLAFFMSLVFLALTVVMSPWLKDYFNFAASAPFIILGMIIVVCVPFTFRNAFLRGKQLFGLSSWAFIVGSASNLVFAAGLVLLGFSTSGVITGLLLSQILAFGLAAYFARRHGFTESLKGSLLRWPDMTLIRPQLRYAGLVLVCSLSITIMYSFDIVLVKHYFDAETAGLYAGVATIARTLFFLTASITQVLMPSVKMSAPDAENRQIFIKSLLLLMAVGGSALLVFCLVPDLIIRVLMGAKYLKYADLLPKLSLAIFILSIVNLINTYNIALRRYFVGLVIVSGTVLTYGLIYFNHASLQAVVNSLLYGSVITLVLFGVWSAGRYAALTRRA